MSRYRTTTCLPRKGLPSWRAAEITRCRKYVEKVSREPFSQADRESLACMLEHIVVVAPHKDSEQGYKLRALAKAVRLCKIDGVFKRHA